MLPVLYLYSFPVPLYGTIIFFAYIAGVWIACRRAVFYGYQKIHILFSSVFAAIGMLAGSKLFYFFTMLPAYITHWELIRTSLFSAVYYGFSGYVFYGGLLGALFMLYLYCLQMDFSTLSFFDTIIPAIPFIHSFGRIGCFFGGCCYGIEYHGRFSVQFPPNELIPELNSVPRFPVQLLEAAALLLLFLILHVNSHHIRQKGFLTGIYLCSYSSIRFIIEFLRADPIRGSFLHLSTAQWMSLPIFVSGFLFLRHKDCKKDSYQSKL